jgi:hypothetical protein
MMRKGLIGVLAFLLAHFGNMYMQDERYEKEIYDSEAKDGFTAVNYDIQRLIIRSYQPLITGPTEADYLIGQVKAVIFRVDWIIKDMGEMNVPDKYEKAHHDLLAAYKSFRPFLTDYQNEVQEAIEQKAVDSPSIQELSDAYQQISLAAEQWYTIYKKENNRSDNKESTLGSLQDRLVYEEYVQGFANQQLIDIEKSILPYVEQKYYDAVYKMQSNQKYSLPSKIAYLKQTKVPEAYEKAHQNLLSTFTAYYNLITNVEDSNVNDDYLEKLTAQYKEMKKAVEDWNKVHLQELR